MTNRPTWIDQDHGKWHPAFRTAMGLMAVAAERRLAATASEKKETQSPELDRIKPLSA